MFTVSVRLLDRRFSFCLGEISIKWTSSHQHYGNQWQDRKSRFGKNTPEIYKSAKFNRIWNKWLQWSQFTSNGKEYHCRNVNQTPLQNSITKRDIKGHIQSPKWMTLNIIFKRHWNKRYINNIFKQLHLLPWPTNNRLQFA